MVDRVNLTVGRVESFSCPAGTAQAFLRDTKAPNLAVRATPSGAKSYVFEAKLKGSTIRLVIGDVKAWSIDKARGAAGEFRVLVDRGLDPRAVERDKAAEQHRESERATTVADVWPVYMQHGKPRRKDAWKPRYVLDLQRAASLGGEPKRRGAGTMKPGHLAPLMPLRLVDIDRDTVREWYAVEKLRAPVQAARAVAMFAGFVTWCATRREYRDLIRDKDCARASGLADMLPPVKRRTDAVELGQLRAWFKATNELANPQARAYLQGLVLTGARREELAALKWSDVDLRWHKLTIADKVDSTRTIPLTPYLAEVLAALPREKLPNGRPNPYVFASPLSKSGRIAEPRAPHAEVLEAAGIEHVTIHGLRRTFSLLGEAAGAPAGAIAQVMGHRPSAVAEGYRPRSLDALRPYLEQIENFILDKAEIKRKGAGPTPHRPVDGQTH